MADPLAEIIRIETPKHYFLDGLWFGPSRAKRVLIFVHGLGSNGFSHHDFLLPLVNKDTAAFFFNNRGHDTISTLRKKSGNKTRRKPGGMAHEVFTESADDIEGAIRFAEKRGAKEIYLVGHSTGCQKAVHYLAKNRKRRHVAGAALLCPISDLAADRRMIGAPVIKKASAAARKLLRKEPQALLSSGLWHRPISAQRFMSLYSGESPEEVFTYWDDARNPKALRKVQVPLFVVLAEKDEYRDRPAARIAAWFAKHLKDGDAITVVRGADHSFRSKEKGLIFELRRRIFQK